VRKSQADLTNLTKAAMSFSIHHKSVTLCTRMPAHSLQSK